MRFRLFFWVVATIMAANGRFSPNSFCKWLQNILVNFLYRRSRILWKIFIFEPGFHLWSESPRQKIRRWKNALGLPPPSIDHQCIDYLRIKLMIFLDDWMFVDWEQYYLAMIGAHNWKVYWLWNGLEMPWLMNLLISKSIVHF